MQPIINFIKDPNIFAQSLLRRLGVWLPDSIYLKWMFRLKTGRRLDLNNPQSFNEKLQWLKLHDRKPEYTTIVDKFAVKEYVSDIIGSEYVIPTLGVWDSVEEIEWDKLPNQFVLKTTHDGGSCGVVICKDKSTFDKKVASFKLRQSMMHNSYEGGREWPYKNVPRRILAEQYIEPAPEVKDLPDYKWYCFNGEPRYCQVIQDRNTLETIDFFDIEWNHQEFVGLNPAAGPAAVPPVRPLNLATQLRIARELSKGKAFSRIDLYVIGCKTYFGEITLYPMSGFGSFSPEEYNTILGKMIILS